MVEKFDALIEDIKQAEDHIHFQYYIYRSDTLGEEVREALTEAARRGVKVRVLLDAWGSTQVSSSFFQNLKKQVEKSHFSFLYSFRISILESIIAIIVKS